MDDEGRKRVMEKMRVEDPETYALLFESGIVTEVVAPEPEGEAHILRGIVHRGIVQAATIMDEREPDFVDRLEAVEAAIVEQIEALGRAKVYERMTAEDRATLDALSVDHPDD